MPYIYVCSRFIKGRARAYRTSMTPKTICDYNHSDSMSPCLLRPEVMANNDKCRQGFRPKPVSEFRDGVPAERKHALAVRLRWKSAVDPACKG